MVGLHTNSMLVHCGIRENLIKNSLKFTYYKKGAFKHIAGNSCICWNAFECFLVGQPKPADGRSEREILIFDEFDGLVFVLTRCSTTCITSTFGGVPFYALCHPIHWVELLSLLFMRWFHCCNRSRYSHERVSAEELCACDLWRGSATQWLTWTVGRGLNNLCGWRTTDLTLTCAWCSMGHW